MSSDYEVLTPKEVCEMLHIHRATLYKLIRKGKLPGFKIGGDCRAGWGGDDALPRDSDNPVSASAVV